MSAPHSSLYALVALCAGVMAVLIVRMQARRWRDLDLRWPLHLVALAVFAAPWTSWGSPTVIEAADIAVPLAALFSGAILLRLSPPPMARRLARGLAIPVIVLAAACGILLAGVLRGSGPITLEPWGDAFLALLYGAAFLQVAFAILACAVEAARRRRWDGVEIHFACVPLAAALALSCLAYGGAEDLYHRASVLVSWLLLLGLSLHLALLGQAFLHGSFGPVRRDPKLRTGFVAVLSVPVFAVYHLTQPWLQEYASIPAAITFSLLSPTQEWLEAWRGSLAVRTVVPESPQEARPPAP